jgi:hypothetical protein
MTDQEYKELGVDIESARQRFLGNRGLFEKFLFRFPNDQNYGKMVEALKAGDLKEAFEGAHALKGVCGNLSLSKLYNEVSELTEMLRAEKLPSQEEIERLEGVYQDTLQLVASIQENGIPEF